MWKWEGIRHEKNVLDNSKHKTTVTRKSLECPRNLEKAGVGGTWYINAGQYKIANVAGTRSVKTVSHGEDIEFYSKENERLKQSSEMIWE